MLFLMLKLAKGLKNTNPDLIKERTCSFVTLYCDTTMEILKTLQNAMNVQVT